MAEYEIKKNIPIPTAQRSYKWPWSRMEVGDCVDIEGDAVYRLKAQRAAHTYGCINNRRFVTRAIDIGVLRVWRAE